MTSGEVVIIGAGHAGFNAAAFLRSENYKGDITLIGAEADLPYQRPPLSKDYIKGRTTDRQLWLRPEKFYADNRISLLRSKNVESLDCVSKKVVTSDSSYSYDHLIIASGTRARLLPVRGMDQAGVEVIRTLEDARNIRNQLDHCHSVVVIGAGFIGLEFAVAAHALGKSVTVLEAAQRVMGRSVSPDISEYVLQSHRNKGINIETSVNVTAIEGRADRVAEVVCKDGQRYACDLLVVGVGVLPNIEVAEAAGLKCEHGIVVDRQLRTSNESVFAIGDCALHPNPFGGGAALRLESIQNATDQARVVAKVLTGQDVSYRAVPWFWSDQGDIKLQMVGLSINPTDFVIRGDPKSGSFSVFHYRDDALIAIDSINHARDHMAGRKLIAQRISPSRDQVSDSECNLKSLAVGPQNSM